MKSWILSIIAALLIAALGAGSTAIVRTETNKVEILNTKENLADFKKEIRDDLKEIRKGIGALLRGR